MSQPLSKPELVRAQWFHELDRQGVRQCVNHLTLGHTVCAMGLLVEIAVPGYREGWPGHNGHAIEHARIAAGLSGRQMSMVTSLNDGIRRMSLDEWEHHQEKTPDIPVPKELPWDLPYEQRSHSFREIKKIVESWFK